MARPLRIVCYAVNGAGLGHVTRLMAIARWLRRLEPLVSQVAPEVIFLTSTEATSVLSEARFAAYKLPSKAVARRCGLDPTEHRRLAKHFIWQTLASLSPDVLIVDTFPQGSFDELLPVLDGSFKKVLVLRELKPDLGTRPIFQAALSLYDHVIVPHRTGGAPDIARVLPPGRTASWVGDVLSVERVTPADPAALRRELGVEPATRLVYLSAGGGGDPGSQEQLRALVTPLAEDPTLHLLVGAGPLYRGRRLVGPRLTWFTDPDVARYFPAVDLALSAGGYNSVHELLHLGVPSAFFAQDKIADQQRARIDRYVAAGGARSLSDLEPATVREAVSHLLEHASTLSARARSAVPENGARFAAAHALAVLPKRDLDATLAAAELLTPRLAAALEGLGAIGSALMKNLAQLDPSPARARPVARAALDPILPRLSSEARTEVLDALRAVSGAEARLAVEDALIGLIAAARRVGATALLPGLLEAALRKHPLAQEKDPAIGRWAVALLGELTRLFTEPVSVPAFGEMSEARRMRGASEESDEEYSSISQERTSERRSRRSLQPSPRTRGWSIRHRIQLYRVFPRLAELPLHESCAAFFALLVAQEGVEVDIVIRRLQTLKLQRRVTLQSLSALLSSRVEVEA